jgi:arylsulfatase A-like enzyme
MPAGLTFFPEYLQQVGYQTGFFGKWHMGNDTGDPQPGFNHWESFSGQGEYYNPRLNVNGKWIRYADSTYVTDLLTTHAIEFMKQQQTSHKPFMVYLSHKGVHDNFSPAKRHKGCYSGKPLVIPPSFDTSKEKIKALPTIDPSTGKAAAGKDYYGENMLPDWVKNQRESWHGVDYSYHGRPWEDQVRNYCETLRSVDESIGSVLDYLKEAGLDENTEFDNLETRIRQVEYLAKKLDEYGIPYQRPAGGHAIFVDATKVLTHVPKNEFPAQTLRPCLHL